MLPAKAIIGAVLALLAAAAILAPSAAATKPCPAGYYCTDPGGEYVLEVEPISPSNPYLGPYADCVWDAHVNFDDGTSADYVFDAAVGIAGSHVFPTPGETYTVVVDLSNGHHGQTKNPCPDYSESGKVLYRTPAEEADDPPFVPTEHGGTVPPLIPVAPDIAIPNPWAPPPLTPASTAYWLQCSRGVLAHEVGCRRARRIAIAAHAMLTRPGSARTSGFACRLKPSGSLLCRRGEQRVLDERPG